MVAQLVLTALEGVPTVRPGADLADIVLRSASRTGVALRDGDIIVVAQKIVS